jgi:cytochrome c
MEAPGVPKKAFSMLGKCLVTLALLASSTLAAQAAGDPVKGKNVYKRCAVCHTDDKGGGDALGPNLFGVVGRKAATRPGYAYSAPLKASNIVWTEANLIKWSASPGRMVPGTKMFFAGITSKNQQADLAAYLKSLK